MATRLEIGLNLRMCIYMGVCVFIYPTPCNLPPVQRVDLCVCANACISYPLYCFTIRLLGSVDVVLRASEWPAGSKLGLTFKCVYECVCVCVYIPHPLQCPSG